MPTAFPATGQSAVLAAARRALFSAFLLKAFETLHQGEPPLRLAWYLEALAHELHQVVTGAENRLMVAMPPRHLKSITVAVAFTAWMLGRNPAYKIMVASYSQELARKHAEDTRTLMEAGWYKALFPNTRIKAGGNRQLEFVTTRGGYRRAISVGGSTTGFGADLLIVDDLMKADDIYSAAAREEVRRVFEGTLITRLNDKAHGAVISIQQRLGEDDLPAYLIERGYRTLVLPAIAEREQSFALGFDRVHHRRVGDVLNPEREDRQTLDRLRRELGPVTFAAQYQQDPVLPGGNLVRLEWFGRVDELPERDDCTRVVQSWDTGMSADPGSDFSVCQTWGYRDGHWYLLDLLRRQYDFPDLLRAVTRLEKTCRPDIVVIEDAGAGKSISQELLARRRTWKSTFRWIMWRPVGSKEERLIGQSGQIEAGLCVLPVEAPWLEPFFAELRAFPTGRHDDQVDCLSQFLEYAMETRHLTERRRDPRTGRLLASVRPRPLPHRRR